MPRAHRLAALVVVLAGCAHGPAGAPAAVQDPAPVAPPAAGPIPAGPPEAPTAPPTPPRGASGATPPRPADTGATADRVTAIRAEVDEFLREQGLLLWNVWTRGAAPDLAPSVAAHRGLFAKETVLVVRRARDAAAGDERRALSLLHSFLVGEFLGRAADEVPGAGPASSVLWDGQPVAVVRIPSLLAAEPSAARRTSLEHAWAEAERSAAARSTARWDAITAAARTLGYPSLLAAAADLRGEPVATLAALAERVLASTDATYRGLMTSLARSELNQPWPDVRGRDLPRLLRTDDKRALVPVAQAPAAAQATFAGIGMSLPSLRGLVVDDQTRAGKDPRALTIPVAVPGDVRVSIVAGDGASDLRGLLHELGAAAYYAGIRASPVEFRRLGAITVATWAHLFGDLVGDPAWLADRTGRTGADTAPLVRAMAARRLHRARLLAAHLLDEIARDRPVGRSGAASRKVLERALLRTADDDEVQLFVADRDPLLQGADELRGVLLSAQADVFLSRRASGPWWRTNDAGAWLSWVFADGSRRAPTELARTMGAEQLDASALLAVTRSRAEAAGLPLP